MDDITLKGLFGSLSEEDNDFLTVEDFEGILINYQVMAQAFMKFLIKLKNLNTVATSLSQN